MAIYGVAHPFEREWLCKRDDGSFEWGPYERHEKFGNWFKAKAAYDTIEPVRDSYNMLKTPFWMKLSD